MKAETKALALAIFLGLLCCVGSGLLGYYRLPPELRASVGLWHALFLWHWPAPLLVFAAFLILGLLTGRALRIRRLAQDELRASRERYAQLFENMPVAIWQIDLDGVVQRANESLCALLGLSKENIVGRCCEEILQTPLCGTERCPLARLRRGETTPSEEEVVITRPDGLQVLCLIYGRPFSEDEGPPTSVIVTYLNLTEQRRAESLFHSLVETMADAVVLVDPQGYVRYANPAACRLLRATEDELVGSFGGDWMDEENQQKWRENLRRRAEGYQDQYELTLHATDGTAVHLLISATPMFDSTGQFLGSFGVMKDITPLKRMTAQLEHLNAVLRAIRNVNQLITREHNRERLLQETCDLLVKTRRLIFTGIALRAEAGTAPHIFTAGEETVRADFDAEIAEAIMAAVHEAHVLEPAAHPALSRWALSWPAGYKAMTARLAYGERDYGALTTLVPAEMAASAEERSLMEELAGDISFALYTLELEQEQQQYQAQLAAEHERTRRILETARALIVCFDLEGRITFFNRACEEVTGYRREEVLGRPVWDTLIPARYLPSVREVFRDLTEASEENTHENLWRTKDGRERLISWRNTRICDATGQVVELVSIGLDITEHRKAELAVRESERRYRLLFNAGHDAICVFELPLAGSPGRLLEANRIMQEFLGYSRTELLQHTFSDLEAPDQAESLDQVLAPLREKGRAFFVRELLTRDGRRLPLEFSAVLFEFEGQPAVLAIGRDITELRETQARLAHLNAVLRAIRNVNQLITRERDREVLLQQACELLVKTRGYMTARIALVSEEGELVGFYGAASKYGDYPPDIPVLQHFWTMLAEQAGPPHPLVIGEQQKEWNAHLRREWEEGQAHLITALQYGERRYGLIAVSVPQSMATDPEEQGLFQEVADDLGFALHAIEVEEQQKRTAAELEQLQRHYEMLAESPVVETFVVRGNRIVFANRTLHERSGYAPGELIGRHVWELIPPEQRYAVLAWRQRRERGEAPAFMTFETQLLKRDGGQRWVQVWAQELDVIEGEVTIIGHMLDITEARELRRQLEHADRLQSLGTLAGGVAHEFNNILQVILFNASLLEAEMKSSSTAAQRLGVIIERTEYGARLTEQLLTFSRPTPRGFTLLDTQALIRNACDLLHGVLPRQITLECDVAPDLWPVRGNTGDLQQVLVNLALNARDAMPNGGRLSVSAQNVELSEAEARRHPQLRPGPYVKMQISDNGVGMPPEIKQRIFEPFFTTKEPGRGTGLGLAIVYGIIKAHRGVITVESTPNVGTTFEILLPAEPEAEITVQPAPERKTPEAALRGQEALLLVDDEVAVLESTAETLRAYGYRVWTARGGKEALEIYRQHSTEIDLVVLDLIMPEMSGRETFVQLKQINPKIRVVVSSGQIPPEEKRYWEQEAAGILRKPFRPEQLLRTIREIFDAGG